MQAERTKGDSCHDAVSISISLCRTWFFVHLARASTNRFPSLYKKIMDNARDLLVNLRLCNSIESENNEGSAPLLLTYCMYRSIYNFVCLKFNVLYQVRGWKEMEKTHVLVILSTWHILLWIFCSCIDVNVSFALGLFFIKLNLIYAYVCISTFMCVHI